MTAFHYEIRVAGSVPATVLAELENVHVATESVQTVLKGPVQDQAALIGIIARLQAWGIELRGVRQVEPDEAVPAQADQDGASPS